jgi:hypothetical protein
MSACLKNTPPKPQKEAGGEQDSNRHRPQIKAVTVFKTPQRSAVQRADEKLHCDIDGREGEIVRGKRFRGRNRGRIPVDPAMEEWSLIPTLSRKRRGKGWGTK